MNQLVAVVGLALLGGAGCDANEAATAGEEDEVEGGSRLDAATAAEMDRKHKDKKERPSDGPNICYSVGMFDRQLKQLDMEAETVTVLTSLPPGPSGSDITGLGHFGGSLVGCQGWPSPQTELVIYDLDGSDWKTLPFSCKAVTGDGDRLWVLESLFGPQARILEFTSFSALAANAPSRVLPAPSAFSLGAGADRNRLITAWHSTHEVVLVDLEDGTQTTSQLEGYDNWIFGSAETAEHRFMVGGWAADSSGVHVFDPDSGASQGRLFADEQLNGLTCDVR